jgi:hypothetical protein
MYSCERASLSSKLVFLSTKLVFLASKLLCLFTKLVFLSCKETSLRRRFSLSSSRNAFVLLSIKKEFLCIKVWWLSLGAGLLFRQLSFISSGLLNSSSAQSIAEQKTAKNIRYMKKRKLHILFESRISTQEEKS